MLNFVLCDDNLSFLNVLDKTLNNLIIKNDYDAKIGFKSTNISAVLDYMSSNKTDVLFLDIQLNSNLNGINIAEKIRSTNKNLYIIFTTGHLEYALLSFQVQPFDYIPKPITAERLEVTLNRLFDDINFASSNFISLNNKTYINQNDINYIKRDGMKLIFKTNNKSYEAYTSFNKVASSLPSSFVRCHKSFIVNINNISHIETSTNTLFFNNETKCYIGPKYKDNFMEVINNGFVTNNLGNTHNT